MNLHKKRMPHFDVGGRLIAAFCREGLSLERQNRSRTHRMRAIKDWWQGRVAYRRRTSFSQALPLFLPSGFGANAINLRRGTRRLPGETSPGPNAAPGDRSVDQAIKIQIGENRYAGVAARPVIERAPSTSRVRGCLELTPHSRRAHCVLGIAIILALTLYRNLTFGKAGDHLMNNPG